jgi:hypothetical protein
MTSSTSTTLPPPFPFELFLSHSLPDYDHEWNIIIVKMIITSVIFLVIIPTLLKALFTKSTKSPANIKSDSSNMTTQVSLTTTVMNDKKKSKQKHSKKKSETKTTSNLTSSSHDGDDTKNACIDGGDVPSILLILINIIYIFILFLFIATSPNNITTSRHVYQAPLLSKAECQLIIDMANRAAQRNAIQAEKDLASIPTFLDDANVNEELMDQKKKLDSLLSSPPGWRKDRHQSYTTTDLNTVIDFTKDDLKQISTLLHSRLSPILEKIYGVSRDSIRANDMFVVRYDADFGQNSLARHTDSSHISFNVLLNDEFEGGGTRYHDLVRGTYYDAKPKPGDVLINNAMVSHEGLATTKGKMFPSILLE